MIRALSLGLLLAVSTWYPHAWSGERSPAPPKGTAMNDQWTKQATELLRLPDSEFFTLSEERRMALADAFSDLSQDDTAPDPAAVPPRLGLGAPAKVDIVSWGRLPVLLGTFQTGLRRWQVNLTSNLTLYVKERTTGQLLHATPLVSVRRGQIQLPSAGGAPPEGAQAGTTGTTMIMIDLLDRMADHLTTTGEIMVTAVAYDARSNTVRIRHEGPDTPPAPVAGKQSYVRSDLDLRPIIEPGIVVPKHGSAKGGFRIRIAAQLTDADGVLRTELNQPFLPAHVVLVRLDEPATIITATPLVQQVVRPDGQPAYNALFLVEIGGPTGHPVAKGEYQAYLDLGLDFLGPYPLKVEE